jgi:deazaflavin-dependent oxidoreductase (nitroreductase family)
MSHMTAVRDPRERGSRFGPRFRRGIRFVARFVNPLTLLVAGRRWMPVVGVMHHRGRRTGRMYATPLGMRARADLVYVPLTFSEHAAWYRNVVAAGTCVVTYLGRDIRLVDPQVVDHAAASPAFPGYERLQFRLAGINEYLVMRISEAE